MLALAETVRGGPGWDGMWGPAGGYGPGRSASRSPYAGGCAPQGSTRSPWAPHSGAWRWAGGTWGNGAGAGGGAACGGTCALPRGGGTEARARTGPGAPGSSGAP